MNPTPLSRTKIETKLAIIREALVGLEKMRTIPEPQFISDPANFAIAEHCLRRALEATFDVAGHIVSRFPYTPGQRPHTLKGVALALGEKSVLDKSFAQETLMKMAGYRNRLVHFYDEIRAPELHKIIRLNLGDFEIFAAAVTALIAAPEKFGLTIED